MKKSLLFILALSAMMTSCATATNKSAEESATASDSTEVRTVECVASGDVVFVDLDYIMSASKFYASEGKAYEAKMQEFQTRATEAQQGWAKKEESLAKEYNKLQNDAAKLQQDYEKGLVTTLKAQERQAELQKKGENFQTRMTGFQTTVQTETAAFQQEEQALAEEQMVHMNRFQAIAREAISEINADRRYKMIVNAVSVVDADPTLNISDLVLQKVDELYAAGALE
jgi:Skp family chaperone for outer membrane proteins